MTLTFLIDLLLLGSAILSALLGVLLLLLGLYDLAVSYWQGDRERRLTAVTAGGTGLVLLGVGYLLQLSI